MLSYFRRENGGFSQVSTRRSSRYTIPLGVRLESRDGYREQWIADRPTTRCNVMYPRAAHMNHLRERRMAEKKSPRIDWRYLMDTYMRTSVSDRWFQAFRRRATISIPFARSLVAWSGTDGSRRGTGKREKKENRQECVKRACNLSLIRDRATRQESRTDS